MTGSGPDNSVVEDPDTTPAEAADNQVTEAEGPANEPFAQLLEQMSKLQSAFDSKIRYDAVREQLVQSMSDELTAYRENRAQLQLRPVLIDLITLHDDLTKAADSAERSAETGKLVGFFRDSVEQMLARHGVEPFTGDADVVDRTRQRVVATEPTEDPTLHRRVAARLRPGFQWNDKVLRPEWVSAFRLVPPAGDRSTAPPPVGPVPTPATGGNPDPASPAPSPQTDQGDPA
ncbi:nucleotide exchange factor GrpE [Micromonospora carbonacea]|uniref:Nucleotide exchange factor GrpE n=1 Tax=Micromonospora carbonacea TaxID=47853 RepID=A0A7H8XTU1_9ACTN|nr:nucleotide exchange factor GrpE [Micromonospora carbonacea]MBB5830030.1 molecular chaperone GrpE (heat shock protein) [Micromonospora carbonacea]QLD28030.1 nucleotide exchange factor GrpE [Micromonospora carbonacea]